MIFKFSLSMAHSTWYASKVSILRHSAIQAHLLRERLQTEGCAANAIHSTARAVENARLRATHKDASLHRKLHDEQRKRARSDLLEDVLLRQIGRDAGLYITRADMDGAALPK